MVVDHLGVVHLDLFRFHRGETLDPDLPEPKVIIRMGRKDRTPRGGARVENVAERGRSQVRLLLSGVEEIPIASETDPDPLPQRLAPRPDRSTGLLDPFVVVTLDAGETQVSLEFLPRPVFRVDGAPRIGSIHDRLGFFGECRTDDLEQFVLVVQMITLHQLGARYHATLLYRLGTHVTRLLHQLGHLARTIDIGQQHVLVHLDVLYRLELQFLLLLLLLLLLSTSHARIALPPPMPK